MIDAPHDAAPIVDAVGGRRVDRDRAHPRAQRPHHRRGGAARGHRRPDLVQPGRPDALGCVHPGRARTTTWPRATAFDVAGTTLVAVLHTPGTRRAAPASTPPISARCSPATRCSAAARARPAAPTATTRRSSTSIRDAAADAARRHRRPHRPRRRHDDRRGGVERRLSRSQCRGRVVRRLGGLRALEALADRRDVQREVLERLDGAGAEREREVLALLLGARRWVRGTARAERVASAHGSSSSRSPRGRRTARAASAGPARGSRWGRAGRWAWVSPLRPRPAWRTNTAIGGADRRPQQWSRSPHRAPGTVVRAGTLGRCLAVMDG